MTEIKQLIDKLENELKSTNNSFIKKGIEEDIATLYKIDQELFYIMDRYQ